MATSNSGGDYFICTDPFRCLPIGFRQEKKGSYVKIACLIMPERLNLNNTLSIRKKYR